MFSNSCLFFFFIFLLTFGYNALLLFSFPVLASLPQLMARDTSLF